MYSVTRYHDISTGHRVWGHESKCAHLHGHNYRIFFTVEPNIDVSDPRLAGKGDANRPLDFAGRVIDFSVVKTLLCEWLEEHWDHKMLIFVEDPLIDKLILLDPDGICPVDFNPTAENMAAHLVNVVGPSVLPGYVRLASCVVEETRKCSATYTAPNHG